MNQRTCPRCRDTTGPVTLPPGKSYCRPCAIEYSREYKQKAKAARIAASPERKCSECETRFRSAHLRNVTCSPQCGKDREWRRRGTRVKISELPPVECSWCGIEFAPKTTHAMFCAPRCKEQDRNVRRATPGGRPTRATGGIRALIGEEAWAERRRVQAILTEANNKIAKDRWSAANQDRLRDTRRRWLMNNREIANERTRLYRARKRNAVTVAFTDEQLAARLEVWGGKCWMCGEPANTVDHVKPLIAKGPHILANFRSACGQCNSAKGGRWYGPAELHRFVK